mmetsp:Transcript_28425/g.61102  ORF Transcript_28425/g.61102 Transcript_28425/m.61102 type:complete len:206 (-) Transcript_28425:165-782(-)
MHHPEVRLGAEQRQAVGLCRLLCHSDARGHCLFDLGHVPAADALLARSQGGQLAHITVVVRTCLWGRIRALLGCNFPVLADYAGGFLGLQQAHLADGFACIPHIPAMVKHAGVEVVVLQHGLHGLQRAGKQDAVAWNLHPTLAVAGGVICLLEGPCHVVRIQYLDDSDGLADLHTHPSLEARLELDMWVVVGLDDPAPGVLVVRP